MNLNNPDLAINGGENVREKSWLDNFNADPEKKEAVIWVDEIIMAICKVSGA